MTKQQTASSASKGKKIVLDVGITDGLQMAFFVRGDATNAEGKIVLERLIAMLETEDIQVSGFADIERHRDDARTQLVHDMTHERGHNH